MVGIHKENQLLQRGKKICVGVCVYVYNTVKRKRHQGYYGAKVQNNIKNRRRHQKNVSCQKQHKYRWKNNKGFILYHNINVDGVYMYLQNVLSYDRFIKWGKKIKYFFILKGYILKQISFFYFVFKSCPLVDSKQVH